MNEIFQTYNYARNNLMFLRTEEAKCRQALMKQPGHVMWMGRIEKVKHDIELLEPVVHQIEKNLNTELQKTVGGEFKFLVTEKENIIKE